MLVESDRHHHFPISPAVFWDVLDDLDAWSAWWPWLQGFEGDGLVTGGLLAGRVRPPLPYSLDVRIHIREATAPALVVASVSGDITGHARMEVSPEGDGCDVRLRSSLGPSRPAMRLLARLAPGVARFGHEWVLDNGARQFRTRALPPGSRSEGSA